MQLGHRLKEERLRLGKSQADLAADLGIAKKSQTNYELGHSAPAADYLAAAAQLGIDVLYVLTGVPSPALKSDEAELLRRYRAASSDVQAVIMAGLGAVVVSGESAPTVAVSGGEVAQVIGGNVDQPGATFNVGGGRKKGKAK